MSALKHSYINLDWQETEFKSINDYKEKIVYLIKSNDFKGDDIIIPLGRTRFKWQKPDEEPKNYIYFDVKTGESVEGILPPPLNNSVVKVIDLESFTDWVIDTQEPEYVVKYLKTLKIPFKILRLNESKE